MDDNDYANATDNVNGDGKTNDDAKYMTMTKPMTMPITFPTHSDTYTEKYHRDRHISVDRK